MNVVDRIFKNEFNKIYKNSREKFRHTNVIEFPKINYI